MKSAKRGRGRPPTPLVFDARTVEGLDELRAFMDLVDLRADVRGGVAADEEALKGAGQRKAAIAARYHVSVKTLEKWTERGRIPPHARLRGKKKASE